MLTRNLSGTSMLQTSETPSRQSTLSTSLFRYSPGLILISIAIADSIRLPDPDLWGHVRFGQAVLKLHRLVVYDPYSYSAAGQIWNNHEWLTEVLMAAIFNHAGVFGLILMKLACTSVVIVFLAAALAETGASTTVQFAVLIASTVVIKPQLQFRPQLITFAMLSILIYVITRDSYRRAGRLWLAIPMFSLWANLHGGFIMGIATLGTYGAVSGLQDVVAGRGYRRAMGLGAITIAATLATLATPYGFGLWEAIAHALRNPYTRAVIQDWRPLMPELMENLPTTFPWLSNYEIGCAAIVATLVSWVMTIEAVDLPLVGVAIVMSLAAILSARNLPIAMLALAAPLARHFPRALKQHSPPQGAETTSSPRSWWINQAVLVSLSTFLFVHYGFFSRTLISPDKYPVGACEFMKHHRLNGNVLASFNWGEYLIWHMAPDSKVFIDGRYDTVYPYEIIRKFIWFNYALPGGDKVLTQFPHDYLLIQPDVAARKLMDSRADWKLIYQDNEARLYARTDSAAAKIPGVPITGNPRAAAFP